MTNYYVTLFLLFIGIYLIQIGVFSKYYSEKLTPYLFNEKINWDPNVDRFKLLISITFLIAPGALMRSFIKFNSNNSIFNYSFFFIIISLLLFLIWLDIKKITPFTLTKKNIEVESEAISQSHKKMEDLKPIVSDAEQTLNDIKKESNSTKNQVDKLKNSFGSFKKSSEEFDNEIKKEILMIKNKLEPNERDSVTIKKRKEVVTNKFEIFKKELSSLESYDNENRALLFSNYDTKEITSYQILLVFFQDYYDISKSKTREIIYSLFNEYFSISAENGINSGNWGYFKNNHLSNVKNFKLYSDLRLNHNKFHSDSE